MFFALAALDDWAGKLQMRAVTWYKRTCLRDVEHGCYVRTVHQRNTFEKYTFDGITKASFDVFFARNTRESPLVLLFGHATRATRESPLVLLFGHATRAARESPLVLLCGHVRRNTYESPLVLLFRPVGRAARENIPVSTFFNLKRIIWFCLTICCTIRLLI